MNGSATARNGKGSIFDRILELTKPKSLRTPPDHLDNNIDLETCVDKYGADITRTYVVLRSYMGKNPPYYENEVIQIQQWFESIWKAILLAHESYTSTQVPTPATPQIPEALYEPGLDTWVDAITDTPRSWVHIAPEKPDIFDSLMEEDDCRLWLKAQRAILSLTQPIGPQNSLQTMKSRLVALTKALIAYDHGCRTLPKVQYHSARVLLCLIAPFAPSFAEECWVVLHYGSGTPSIGGDEELDEVLYEIIDEDLAGNEDLRKIRDLPRQGRPETLRSIFDQPFPVAEPEETIDLLKDPSLLSQARAEKRAKIEKGKIEQEQVCKREARV